MYSPSAALKRFTLQANQIYWRAYWNWYWNVRHNAFYVNLAKYPMGLTVLVCGLRYTAGDAIAQHCWRATVGDALAQFSQHHEGGLNRKRTATFLAFGCLSGIYTYAMYSKFYPMLMRRFHWRPITCIVFENSIPCPIIYYGAFYVTQGFIQTGHLDLPKALSVANHNRMDDLKSLWAFWGPMHFVSFNFVSPSMRGVFAATVGTGWVFILSMLRGEPAGDWEGSLEEEDCFDDDKVLSATLPMPIPVAQAAAIAGLCEEKNPETALEPSNRSGEATHSSN